MMESEISEVYFESSDEAHRYLMDNHFKIEQFSNGLGDIYVKNVGIKRIEAVILKLKRSERHFVIDEGNANLLVSEIEDALRNNHCKSHVHVHFDDTDEVTFVIDA